MKKVPSENAAMFLKDLAKGFDPFRSFALPFGWKESERNGWATREGEGRAQLTDSGRAAIERYEAKLAEVPCEIEYRIPGKGSPKRKTFASEAKAQAFVEKLIEREGSDVEVKWGA